ncbi:MAG TPA: hypothetical protein VM871_07115, partial [Flavisolibacter sp.]|nr:hypothetical protein [Flavisolibacter sp.]
MFTNSLFFYNGASRALFCLLAAIIGQPLSAQFVIEQSTTFVTRGAHIVVDDLDFFNASSLDGTASTFHFTGNKNTTLFGGGTNGFTHLQINKGAGKEVKLLSPIFVTTDLAFISGNLELNGNEIALATGANLVGESETSRITGVNGGEVRTQAVLSSPNGANIGNLGAVVTSTQNLGNVVIR